MRGNDDNPLPPPSTKRLPTNTTTCEEQRATRARILALTGMSDGRPALPFEGRLVVGLVPVPPNPPQDGLARVVYDHRQFRDVGVQWEGLGDVR